MTEPTSDVHDGLLITPDRIDRGGPYDRDGFCRRCQQYGPEFCTCVPRRQPQDEP